MTPQQERVINDNPNLSSAALSRFLGVSTYSIIRFRGRPLWRHSGVGIPFVYQSVNKDGVYKCLAYKGRTLAKGSLENVMENLDRLIYCLDNNNGKLPKTFHEYLFDDLEFIKKDN